jgi:hypothetical protein
MLPCSSVHSIHQSANGLSRIASCNFGMCNIVDENIAHEFVKRFAERVELKREFARLAERESREAATQEGPASEETLNGGKNRLVTHTSFFH